MSEQQQPIDMAEYRHRARAWLEANLARRAGPARRAQLTGHGDMTGEKLAEQRALQRKLYEAGYAGISWPAEYGGQGLPASYERAFDEEAREFVLPDFGIAGGTTFGVCARTMLVHGSPEFLKRHIPGIISGERLFVQFFSDPEAGSDLAGVRTRADRDGDGWVLNGSKIWTSGAYYADYGMCLARTDWDVPKHRGLTWFAVPIRADGVTVHRIRQINGDAEFCQEFFDDVRLTEDDVIGTVDDGWTVTQTMLLYERGSQASAAPAESGTGADARVLAPDLVALAAQVGRLADPLVQQSVVRTHIDDLARRHLDRRIGRMMGVDPMRASSFASYSKLASGTYDPIRANAALDIAGADATTWLEPGEGSASQVALSLLNSRFLSIAGGTNEVQRNTIGERVLGLPREPSFDSRRPFREVIRAAKNWSGKVG
ncbi:acyl-CoA dehydrogenase family protein [Streptomyces sp. NPDC059894]|uniref:acyl-CoA dehydrogenase family protein n=1 Tax=unclassified Streptomyces TaxID=2593676 RepID=UPI0036475020